MSCGPILRGLPCSLIQPLTGPKCRSTTSRPPPYFAFRIDIWDATGNSIVEHIAGIDDFEVAVATYWAAIARWPRARITLRQGIRAVHESGQQTPSPS